MCLFCPLFFPFLSSIKMIFMAITNPSIKMCLTCKNQNDPFDLQSYHFCIVFFFVRHRKEERFSNPTHSSFLLLALLCSFLLRSSFIKFKRAKEFQFRLRFRATLMEVVKNRVSNTIL